MQVARYLRHPARLLLDGSRMTIGLHQQDGGRFPGKPMAA